MKAYDAGKARPSELVAIVHQVLDVELDAPMLDSATWRACVAFVQVILDTPGESFPELDALRARCEMDLSMPPISKWEPYTPEPMRVIPPTEDPRLAVWDRAYLAALEQMIRVVSPSSDEQLRRCSGIAEIMGVIAVQARAQVSAPGALDELQQKANALMQDVRIENDRQRNAI